MSVRAGFLCAAGAAIGAALFDVDMGFAAGAFWLAFTNWALQWDESEDK